MGIIRVSRSADFSVIKNTPLRDKTLSWGARGLLAYLLTKPDNWVVRMDNLVTESPGGIRSVRTILKELERAGYFTRKRVRGEDGMFVWESTIHESPPAIQIPLDKDSIGTECVDAPCIDGKRIDIVSTELPNTEKPSSATAEAITAVKAVFEYYKSRFGVLDSEYKLTKDRLFAGVARYKECRLRSDSGQEAVDLMCDAIDSVADNAWAVERGLYDWTNNIFRSREMFESRLLVKGKKK